jgi:hypothetical protein
MLRSFTFTEPRLLMLKAFCVYALMVLSRLNVMVLLLLASAPATAIGMVTDTAPISDSNAGNKVSFTLLHEKRPIARLPAKGKCQD